MSQKGPQETLSKRLNTTLIEEANALSFEGAFFFSTPLSYARLRQSLGDKFMNKNTLLSGAKTRRNLAISIFSFLLPITIMTACSEREQKKAEKIDPAEAPITTSQEKKVENNPNKNAYFGDFHVHTGNSFDAYIFYTRTTPADAYRYARGQTIRHPLKYKLNLTTPPLDFLAVTDHAEYLGILKAINETDHPISKAPNAQDMFSFDDDKIFAAFSLIGNSIRTGEIYEDFYDADIVEDTWKRTQQTADEFYEPGKFTTFKGYEYTATRPLMGEDQTDTFTGGNLHRNVIFKDAAPKDVFGSLQSPNPEDLWDWMDKNRANGIDVISIPHNSNVSNGEMFSLQTYYRNEIDAAYSEQRRRNEPIVEITQVKGTSETHPALSPTDEWSNFELYEYLLSSEVKSKINGSFVREALANGIGLEQSGKGNPYKFGLIGSTDSHVAAGSYDEDYYWSKVGLVDGTKVSRGSVAGYFNKSWEHYEPETQVDLWFGRWGASGYAGIWATQNTREALFDSLQNRETFATTGTRIRVRFFAGYDYEDTLLSDPKLLEKAYQNGVPMGGELNARKDSAPTLLAWAMRDPYAAPLQRLQIVKVWHANGAPQEKLFDVACSDGLKPDPNTHRCPDNGAKVDISDCSITRDKGDPELSAIWQDPEYDSAQSAAYYVRVLENPTCRWSTWDAVNVGAEPNPIFPKTIQERAWSSPIWVNTN